MQHEDNVMNEQLKTLETCAPEQCRLFLVMVLESIEFKLVDHRSLNILTKLRTNKPITDEDRAAARAAARAPWETTWGAAASAAASAAARAMVTEAAAWAAAARGEAA